MTLIGVWTSLRALEDCSRPVKPARGLPRVPHLVRTTRSPALAVKHRLPVSLASPTPSPTRPCRRRCSAASNRLQRPSSTPHLPSSIVSVTLPLFHHELHSKLCMFPRWHSRPPLTVIFYTL